MKNTDIDFEIFDVEFAGDLNEKTDNIGLGPKELRLVQLLNQNKSLKDIENIVVAVDFPEFVQVT